MLDRWYAAVGRRRLLAGLGVAVVIAVIAAVAGITGGGGHRSTQVRAASAARAPERPLEPAPVPGGVILPTESPLIAPTTSVPPTTTPAVVLGYQVTRIPGQRPAPPPSPSGPPPTTRHCHDSTDPACGPFSWDPAPGPNDPMTGSVTAAPATATAGQTVTFHVTATDPDAAPLTVCNVAFGDGSDIVCDPGPRVNPGMCPKQYGPWAPPARQRGDLDTTLQHTYQNPGTYDVAIQVNSAQEACNNPYASSLVVKTTVVVTPASG